MCAIPTPFIRSLFPLLSFQMLYYNCMRIIFRRNNNIDKVCTRFSYDYKKI